MGGADDPLGMVTTPLQVLDGESENRKAFNAEKIHNIPAGGGDGFEVSTPGGHFSTISYQLQVKTGKSPPRQEAFQNERWFPLKGWSSANLLPMERKGWSDEQGLVSSERLSTYTTNALQPGEVSEEADTNADWEDVNHPGADDQGWSYACCFFCPFYPSKSMTSCVRRKQFRRKPNNSNY
jgi:hypothetical protein